MFVFDELNQFIKFLYPSSDGYAYLDRLKISYDPIPGDGSIPHRFWQHRIWTRVRRKGDLGGIEYQLNGKRVDVAIIRPRERIAFEVVMTGPLLTRKFPTCAKIWPRGSTAWSSASRARRWRSGWPISSAERFRGARTGWSCGC